MQGSSANEMASRIAAFDWSATVLGPIKSWPASLRVAVDLCLNNRFPMHVWWGPQLINIYNDAHIPVLGNRHPQALGRPASHVWADAWSVLGPQVEGVVVRGESTWNNCVEVVLERSGSPQSAWFTWSYSPIIDVDGTIGGLICIATEDTARMLAERERDLLETQRQQHHAREKAMADEALRNSNTLLKGISDSTDDVIFAKDRQGRMLFANPAALVVMGKPLPEVLGKTDMEILENLDAARGAMDNDRRVMETGIAADFEEWVPLPGGSHRTWFSRKMPYRDADGNVIGLLGISRDITDRKTELDELRRAKEAAETASKAKDRLLAVVSHELRTPLNPILAIASSLEALGDLPANLREDVVTIRRNVELEARIVDDLLNVTRLQRGKIILHQEALDLHKLVRTVIAHFADRLATRKITVDARLDAATPHVWADPGRMQQVISNLLDNAIKFTPDPGVVCIRSQTLPGHRVQVEFIDSGVGIDPAILPKLFTPFEQGEQTVTRRFGGLGLGLVIVKGIVDLHGGSVTAGSAGPGKGTTVTLELSAMESVAPALVATSPLTPKPERSGQRILLVEDHEDTLRIMKRILTNLGYVVKTAVNVKDAIRLTRIDEFDLLLSDIGLPDGSGLDIMRALRAQQTTPGVALSGFGNEDDLSRSKDAGFSEHLVKPVDLKTLDTTLKRILRSDKAVA